MVNIENAVLGTSGVSLFVIVTVSLLPASPFSSFAKFHAFHNMSNPLCRLEVPQDLSAVHDR